VTVQGFPRSEGLNGFQYRFIIYPFGGLPVTFVTEGKVNQKSIEDQVVSEEVERELSDQTI